MDEHAVDPVSVHVDDFDTVLAACAPGRPSSTSWSRRERRTATIANSVATKNPLASTSTNTDTKPSIAAKSIPTLWHFGSLRPAFLAVSAEPLDRTLARTGL